MASLISDFLLRNLNPTYTERFAYNYAIKATVCALFLTLISSMARAVCQKFKKKVSTKGNPMNRPSYFNFDDFYLDIPFDDLRKYRKKKNSSYPILVQLAFLLSSIGHFFSYLVYGAIPAILSSLGIIPVSVSFLLILLISAIMGCFMVRHICPSEVKPHIKEKLKDQSYLPIRKLHMQAYCVYKLYPYASKVIVSFAFFYAIFLPLLTAKSCLAYYTPEYGSAFDAYTMSTNMIRLFSFSFAQICPAGRICHVYSTLPEDPSTSVFLNIHTGADIDILDVHYSSEEDLEFSIFRSIAINKTAQSDYLNLEWKGKRYVHSIYLDNLEPNTPYYAQFYHQNKFLGDARFSTLPDSRMQSNITMVVGGDSSGTDKSLTFINHIADYKPDVIIVGGDIVYDNGNVNCYYCWDFYLDQFSELNKRVGRLVPLILAVGNHDVGMNNHQFRNIDKSKNLLFRFFPQHLKPNSTIPQVPKPEERMSYFHHRIGNTLHLFLDSGYLTNFGEFQTSWMINLSIKYPNLAKFATYHVPIFPGCFFKPTIERHDSRFHSWIPVFEAFNFLGVFENHVHLFKRTFPLAFTNSSRSPGVVYFGDGAWGVGVNDCFDEDPNPNVTEVFAKVDKVNHVWIVKLSNKVVEYSAINLKGEVIDNYKQNISDYVHNKKKFQRYHGNVQVYNSTISTEKTIVT